MISRAAVVTEARTWVGVPFLHQGRSRTGVDCAGLVIEVARALGMPAEDVQGYGRQPGGALLDATLDAQCARVQYGAWGLGDVLLMRFAGDPQHLAIVSALEPAPYIIHVWSGVGRCVEHRLDDQWRRRIVRAYRLPGVE